MDFANRMEGCVGLTTVNILQKHREADVCRISVVIMRISFLAFLCDLQTGGSIIEQSAALPTCYESS